MTDDIFDTPRKEEPDIFSSNYNKQKKARRHEIDLAQKLGGRKRRNSGRGGSAFGCHPKKGGGYAGRGDVGDVAVGDLLFDAKRTDYKSITITDDMLRKIWVEAVQSGREPALSLEFGGIPEGLVERRWVVVPESVMKRLLGGE